MSVRLAIEQSFVEDQRLLWGVCYRMTGNAADADELLMDTFARALERPPSNDRPLRPWLVTVAMNLSRDLLRRRKRRGYRGTWLPSPVVFGDDALAPDRPLVAGEMAARLGGSAAFERPSAARYELAESVTMAFLVALEELTAAQRAVLVLRDVLDYSVRETAAALDLSEANVKTTLHRVRHKMSAYDAARVRPDEMARAAVRQALERLVASLLRGDLQQIESLLVDDVRALSDGGEEFSAARVAVVGAVKVAKFYARISAMRTAAKSVEIRNLNGCPALLVDFGSARPREAPRVVTMLDVAPDGRIRKIYSQLTTAKIAHLWDEPGLSDDASA